MRFPFKLLYTLHFHYLPPSDERRRVLFPLPSSHESHCQQEIDRQVVVGLHLQSAGLVVVVTLGHVTHVMGLETDFSPLSGRISRSSHLIRVSSASSRHQRPMQSARTWPEEPQFGGCHTHAQRFLLSSRSRCRSFVRSCAQGKRRVLVPHTKSIKCRGRPQGGRRRNGARMVTREGKGTFSLVPERRIQKRRARV